MIPINIHTHFSEGSNKTIELQCLQLNKEERPGKSAFCSAGWHPWDAQQASLEMIREAIVSAVKWPQTIALGECGLDRVCRVDLEIQKKVLILHLELAKEYNLPLIIHCVKAYSDLLHELKTIRFKGKMVLHAFHGNHQQVKSLLRYDSYFSIGSGIASEVPHLVDSLRFIPSGRLFLETDSTDVPILDVYRKVADIKKISIEELALEIVENFKAVFPAISLDSILQRSI